MTERALSETGRRQRKSAIGAHQNRSLIKSRSASSSSRLSPLPSSPFASMELSPATALGVNVPSSRSATPSTRSTTLSAINRPQPSRPAHLIRRRPPPPHTQDRCFVATPPSHGSRSHQVPAGVVPECHSAAHSRHSASGRLTAPPPGRHTSTSFSAMPRTACCARAVGMDAGLSSLAVCRR